MAVHRTPGHPRPGAGRQRAGLLAQRLPDRSPGIVRHCGRSGLVTVGVLGSAQDRGGRERACWRAGDRCGDATAGRARPDDLLCAAGHGGLHRLAGRAYRAAGTVEAVGQGGRGRPAGGRSGGGPARPNAGAVHPLGPRRRPALRVDDKL